MYKILKFDLARNALKHITKFYEIKEMYIPYYLCDVVRHSLVSVGCKPLFYHIDDNFFPSKVFEKYSYILYPNYWGICGNNVKKLAKIYPNLIVDNAHAFYDNPEGIACFNAGHKFGYKESLLWIREEGSTQKYKTYNNYTYPNKVDKTAKERQKKFRQLHEKYGASNRLKINTNSYPFLYPYLAMSIHEADRLVKELQQKGQMIYRYWSNLPKNYNEYKFYSRLVPIQL